MVAMALAQYGSGVAITALLHPFGYAKVLMQVGYEPLPPEKTTSLLFRKEVYEYPNILRYISHMKSVDGFFGLYKGIVPRVVAGTLGNFVQFNVHDRIKSAKKNKQEKEGVNQKDEEFVVWIQAFAKETSEDTLSRCCGLIVSHPFHVIMMRCMVQFVGKETKYNSMFSSVIEIYKNDGILGYFSGLIPRLIGEIITIWVTSFLAKSISKYLIQEKEFKSYTGAACSLIVSTFTYPFTLTANVMAVSNCGLVAGQLPFMPKYTNWVDCMSSLSKEGSLKRGSSAFWRVYKPAPTILPTFVKVEPTRQPRHFKNK